MEFTKLATAAAWASLVHGRVRGWRGAKLHTAIVRKMRASVMKPKPEELTRLAALHGLKDGEAVAQDIITREAESFDWVGGPIELTDDETKYLVEAVSKALDGGISGDSGRAYGDLIDVLPDPTELEKSK